MATSLRARTRLAIDGGRAVRSQSFPPWPFFDEDERSAVDAVLRSGRVNYWTGDEGRRFESEFASFVGCRHGVALANGTVALEAALRALHIGAGDEVICTSRTFIASASCVVMVGARPVMADVDPVSQNVTADTIAAAVTPRTKGIVAVHLAGWPCDMDPIMELAGHRGFAVIEDCAQAHGATYRGSPIGSLGHIAAFSFCQDKIMTTGGEGGMVTTNDEGLWKRVWSFKDHGKRHDTMDRPPHARGLPWPHESFGTNWRMTEMQSAIGRVMLRRLPKWLERRRRHAAALTEAFRRLPALRVTEPGSEVGHAWYKYYAFVRPERLRAAWTRDRIVAAVTAEGIPCFRGTCSEIYLEPAFEQAGLQPEQRLPVARQLGETSLMFLVHPTLTDSDISDTVEAVTKVLSEATG